MCCFLGWVVFVLLLLVWGRLSGPTLGGAESIFSRFRSEHIGFQYEQSAKLPSLFVGGRLALRCQHLRQKAKLHSSRQKKKAAAVLFAHLQAGLSLRRWGALRLRLQGKS